MVRLPDLTVVLIVAFAAAPGLLGDRAYRAIVGVGWRDTQIQSLLRLTAFSIVGLALYSLITRFGLPPASYIFPSAIKAATADSLAVASMAYLGHCSCSFLAGGLGAAGVRLLAKLSGETGRPCVWDDFVRNCAAKRWVVISLTNDDCYCGMLQYAAISVGPEDRELVLTEPCQYDPERRDYVALPYQFLFLPARLVVSIAAVSDLDSDKRVVAIGDSPFQGVSANVETSPTLTTSAAAAAAPTT